MSTVPGVVVKKKKTITHGKTGRTDRKGSQGRVELTDKIAKHGGCSPKHDVLGIIVSIGRCCLSLRLKYVREGLSMSANRDLAVPVRLCKIVLQARAASQAVEVLRKARETVYRVFVRIAISSRRTTAEPFAAGLVEIFLEPGEGRLVVRDGFGDLLLRRLEEFIFEEERAGEQR
jgi:hypothetical protein